MKSFKPEPSGKISKHLNNFKNKHKKIYQRKIKQWQNYMRHIDWVVKRHNLPMINIIVLCKYTHSHRGI